MCLSGVVRISLIASETVSPAGHYKNKEYMIPQIHYTHMSWIQGSIAHRPFSDSVAYTADMQTQALTSEQFSCSWLDLKGELNLDKKLAV